MGVVDVGGEKSNGVIGADVNVVETFINGEKVGNRLHRQEKLGTKLGGNNTMPRIQSSRKLTWKKRHVGEKTHLKIYNMCRQYWAHVSGRLMLIGVAAKGQKQSSLKLRSIAG
jgi:hypothetical protein